MCFLDAMMQSLMRPTFRLYAVARRRGDTAGATHGRAAPVVAWRYLLPQQFSRPNAVSLLSTPGCTLSVISVTPVS
ncbi:hypothetical protein LMG29542_03043 [Paraburkholderia humisilvae]|uniref:Uncharacterized protein n=1 Tax=Paraburkholderia humisilvae TaxID=627669 RepID=A0A6J5DUU7_9BURK|nr:hypothetical protein LMG29542_03043 [Paraburkholderia humisilvae]